MTIIWCGGEDADFPGGTIQISTNATYRRSSYSRCALYGSTGWLGTRFPEMTSLWFSFQTYHSFACLFAGVVGDDNITGYYVQSDNDEALLLRKYEGSLSTVATSAIDKLQYQGVNKIDIKITNYGVSGNIKCYVNGFEVIDYTADLTLSGLTGFVKVRGHGNSSAGGFLSELIVADEDTRLLALKTLVPDGAGDANDWTGDYTDIDEITSLDADKIYTETKGDDFQANLTGMPAGVWKVKGVKTLARCVDSQAILGLKVGIKTNSAVHLSDAHTLGGGYAVLEKMYLDNPETVTAFTSGEIDALQLAYRCDSTTTTTSTSSSTTTTS